MPSIEERILSMKFDNSQFASGATQAISMLGKLQSALQMKGATQGVEQVQGALGKLNSAGSFNGLHQAIDGSIQKFSAMTAAANAMVMNITNRITNMGINFAKSLTVEPIMDGFREYETKMGSIQTILANTHDKGTTLDEVKNSLGELNTYADKTIYNFGDMTKNIGLFTNAGIGIRESTSMIKGFSNAAAASGTNAQGAAGAAYQLSQALSAGQIRLMDWRSLQNVGMGNKNMQNGLIEIADAMGTLGKAGASAESIQKDFNGSLEKGWLSADVMSNYLQIMAGDMDETKMASLGLSEAQIKNFKEQQVIAEEAATKVRTFTQLMSTMKEAVGSGWSETWELLLGDFEGATELFTGINNAVGKIVESTTKARNDLIKGWVAIGGRTDLINGIGAAFSGVMMIITQFKNALTNVFPPMTAEKLKGFTDVIANLGNAFNSFVMTNRGTLLKIFTGLASALHIVTSLFGGLLKIVARFFAPFLANADSASGGVLRLVASVLSLFATFDKLLSKSDIFEKIAQKAEHLAEILSDVFSMIFNGDFTGSSGWAEDSGIVDFFLSVHEAIMNVETALHVLFTGDFKRLGTVEEDSGMVAFFLKAHDAIMNVANAISILATGDFKPWGDWEEDSGIVDFLFRLRDGFVNAFKSITSLDFGGAFDKIGARVAPMSGIFDTVWKALGKLAQGFGPFMKAMFEIGGKLGDVLGQIGQGFGKSINELNFSRIFDGLNVALIGALGASLIGFINGLTGSIRKGQGAFGEFKDIFHQINGTLKSMQAELKAKALRDIAVAIAILAGALFVLSLIDSDKLAGATLALGAVALGLTKFLEALGSTLGPKQAKSIIMVSSVLMAIGLAILVLAGGLMLLSSMSWNELMKGMVGLTIILADLVLLSRGIEKNGRSFARAGRAMIPLAIGINLLVLAVKGLGGMDIVSLSKGVAALGIIMLEIAAFSRILEKGRINPRMAVGILLIAAAMNVMADAVSKFGTLDTVALVKGVAAVGVILVEFALFSRLIIPEGLLATGVAMVIMAHAISQLSESVKFLGSMDLGSLAKGIGAVGLVLLEFGLFSRLFDPDRLLLTSAAMVVMAVAIGMMSKTLQTFGGMSIAEIAKSLGMLAGSLLILVAAMRAAQSGLAGAGAIVVMAVALNMLVPVLKAFSNMSWGEIVKGLIMMGGALLILVGVGYLAQGAAIGLAVLGAAMLALGAGVALAGVGLMLLATAMGALAVATAAGTASIVGFLAAIIGLIPLLVGKLGEAVIVFLNTFIQAAPLFLQATVAFFRMIITAITTVIPEVVQGLVTLITAILTALVGMAAQFLQTAVVFLMTLIEAFTIVMPAVIQALVLLVTNLIIAVNTLMPLFFQTAVNFVMGLLQAIQTVAPAVIETLMFLIQSLLDALEAHVPNFVASGMRIITGFLQGIADHIGEIIDAGADIIIKFLDGIQRNFDRIATKGAEVTVSFVNSVADAIRNNQGAMKAAGASLATAIADGLTGGLFSKVADVASAAWDLGKRAINAIKEATDSHSPSREADKIGRWVGVGYALGLENEARTVSNSAKKVGQASLDALNKAFAMASDAVPDGLVLSPTIRPVMDLDDVKSGVRSMDGMLGARSLDISSGFRQASRIGANQYTAGSVDIPVAAGQNVTNVALTQNIQSPKAVDHLEVYRQTNNLLNSVKEALNQ